MHLQGKLEYVLSATNAQNEKLATFHPCMVKTLANFVIALPNLEPNCLKEIETIILRARSEKLATIHPCMVQNIGKLCANLEPSKYNNSKKTHHEHQKIFIMSIGARLGCGKV